MSKAEEILLKHIDPKPDNKRFTEISFNNVFEAMKEIASDAFDAGEERVWDKVEGFGNEKPTKEEYLAKIFGE